MNSAILLPLMQLKKHLEGELFFDELHRTIYTTDASIYREMPLAVAYPRTVADLKKLIAFARENNTSLIPRAAGTSLAGQCVGKGIVVDISKYWNKILSLDVERRSVKVQPGVIRDQLNEYLKPWGLYFGPNTSTANRCMIGGMVGNNSCGSTSIVYGSTRDHLMEAEALLSDGSEVIFRTLSTEEFQLKLQQPGLEGDIYRQIYEELNEESVRKAIRQNFPKPQIQRRNTGYAVDLLLNMQPFTAGGPEFNFCKLLAGSEGTLAFMTAITLQVVPLPAPYPVVLVAHFRTMHETLEATLIAMRHHPDQCELMDKAVLDCTKDNRQQAQNRFFIDGDPAAVLMIEFRAATSDHALEKAIALADDLKKNGLGYTFPLVSGKQTNKIWELRSAGLGVLSNMPGDAKPIPFIEDTAVALEDLPAYIHEFDQLMQSFGQKAVYYAHAGAGELHLRPVLNLKKSSDVQLMRRIAEASALLVKKYRGSLSGEHGDGRVRAEFIPLMLGKENYELFRRIKKTWDPCHIFNPGKITDPPAMTDSLRYIPDSPTPAFDTIFDFSAEGGILRAAEKCNGSGDCRRLDFAGGTMCPSYRATRDEKDTTRARANALREILSHPPKNSNNPFDSEILREVIDLCLMCKACSTECPSNVDMTTMKAEFLYQYWQTRFRVPFRTKFFAHIGRMNQVLSVFPALPNWLLKNPSTNSWIKKLTGIAQQRSLPLLHPFTLRQWYRKNKKSLLVARPKKKVFLFCDEFTNYYDVKIGMATLMLLSRLGYQVEMPPHAQSGRAQLSKGLLKEAKDLARRNVRFFAREVKDDAPLLGIEPSAILSFRDEYPRLVPQSEVAVAKNLAAKVFLTEEFLYAEMQAGNISPADFTRKPARILLHGHCHQKALSSLEYPAWILSLPENYQVEIIPSGCCGMAGSFGYETEHYEISMKIGELVLFPAIRQAAHEIIIAASGTSCRHQIADGTNRTALHPVEILFTASIEKATDR